MIKLPWETDNDTATAGAVYSEAIVGHVSREYCYSLFI